MERYYHLDVAALYYVQLGERWCSMGRAKPLAAMFVMSVGSVMFLSACKKAEAPVHEHATSTAPAATATQTAIVVTAPHSGDEVDGARHGSRHRQRFRSDC